MKISYEQWIGQYKIHMDESNPDSPRVYETYGDDSEAVRLNRDKVWTMIEGDEPEPDEIDEDEYYDTTHVMSGYHYVNRIHYFIGDVEAPPYGEVEVEW